MPAPPERGELPCSVRPPLPSSFPFCIPFEERDSVSRSTVGRSRSEDPVLTGSCQRGSFDRHEARQLGELQEKHLEREGREVGAPEEVRRPPRGARGRGGASIGRRPCEPGEAGGRVLGKTRRRRGGRVGREADRAADERSQVAKRRPRVAPGASSSAHPFSRRPVPERSAAKRATSVDRSGAPRSAATSAAVTFPPARAAAWSRSESASRSEPVAAAARAERAARPGTGIPSRAATSPGARSPSSSVSLRKSNRWQREGSWRGSVALRRREDEDRVLRRLLERLQKRLERRLRDAWTSSMMKTFGGRGPARRRRPRSDRGPGPPCRAWRRRFRGRRWSAPRRSRRTRRRRRTASGSGRARPCS